MKVKELMDLLSQFDPSADVGTEEHSLISTSDVSSYWADFFHEIESVIDLESKVVITFKTN